MPYKFKIQSINSRRLLCISSSKIENTYIDYTAQGFLPENQIASSLAAEWITKFDPEETLSGYSRPVQLYNPEIYRFLGDTEETVKISGTENKTGSIAGSMRYDSPDTSIFFIFRNIGENKFKIYQYESDNNALNHKKLIIDIENLSRVLISSEIINNSTTLDDSWQIIKIAD